MKNRNEIQHDHREMQQHSSDLPGSQDVTNKHYHTYRRRCEQNLDISESIESREAQENEDTHVVRDVDTVHGLTQGDNTAPVRLTDGDGDERYQDITVHPINRQPRDGKGKRLATTDTVMGE